MKVFNVERGDRIMINCRSGNQYRMIYHAVSARSLWGIMRRKDARGHEWFRERERHIDLACIVSVRRITGKL